MSFSQRKIYKLQLKSKGISGPHACRQACHSTYQGWSTEEDSALLPYYDTLIWHGRNIGATGCAWSHDNSNLQRKQKADRTRYNLKQVTSTSILQNLDADRPLLCEWGHLFACKDGYFVLCIASTSVLVLETLQSRLCTQAMSEYVSVFSNPTQWALTNSVFSLVRWCQNQDRHLSLHKRDKI